ncbi:phosphate signaling complex protein PhoU [Imhoffiella purpurea]|uniref:Phosphate transport system regulatory protein PhoU n=1 Tax=Imhoffiella purpurea TaxID=1249627 RepID=W9VC91_9GAMM|nr:phosphate signaling complex protein PhoU [Imhoffiella purpurea]EXJ14606.1 Phosphate transport system regulatory protein PhoU [Imhoffiella purpurea]
MTDTNASRPVPDLGGGHTVRRYDEELAKLRAIILEMGEHVVGQTQSALAALVDREESQAYRVLDREPQIDYLSLDADEEVFRVIVRRQPTAVDLRIVLAMSKIAGDVERAGDKATSIAGQALELKGLAGGLDELPEELKQSFRALYDRACCMFEQSIQAVAHFDVALSLGIFEDEPPLCEAGKELRRLLGDEERSELTPRQIVCLLTSAHALERVGRHASNIAEQVIYVALGQDVRYRNREILIETLRHQGY